MEILLLFDCVLRITFGLLNRAHIHSGLFDHLRMDFIEQNGEQRRNGCYTVIFTTILSDTGRRSIQ